MRMTAATLTTGGWELDSAQEGFGSLRYEPTASSRPEDLGPDDVLVEIHAASLNYRDLVITKAKAAGAIHLAATPNVTPGSDGAGVIIAVGTGAAQYTAREPWLRPGAKVVTHMVATQDDALMPGMAEIGDGLGQRRNGTLCRRTVVHRSCVVPMPAGLRFEEAATLSCSGLTAYNALMGVPGREVKEGDWVLVQGTGGVSVAALQIAVAAGANVIAITSSDDRADKLASLGAIHVINYKKEKKWGEIARSLTPEKRGVDHVVDVVGPPTLVQSLAAVRSHGLITIAGMLGAGAGDDKDPGMMSALAKQTTYRGLILGSRKMFLDLVRFVEQRGVKPAVDDVEFSLEEAKGAYERMQRREHFSKVIIRMD